MASPGRCQHRVEFPDRCFTGDSEIARWFSCLSASLFLCFTFWPLHLHIISRFYRIPPIAYYLVQSPAIFLSHILGLGLGLGLGRGRGLGWGLGRDWAGDSLCVQNTMLFACGDGGLLARLDPETLLWAVDPSPTLANLTSIVAMDPYNVFAAGRGGIMVFFNGLEWSLAPAQAAEGADLYGLAATAVGRAWCVGARATLLFLNGTYWLPEAAPAELPDWTDFYAVSALPGDNTSGIPETVVAVGTGGAAVRRYPATGVWVLMEPAATAPLYGVFVAGPRLAYAVGANGTVAQWNGSGWVLAAVPAAASSSTFYAVSGDGSGTVVAVGAGGAALSLSWTG